MLPTPTFGASSGADASAARRWPWTLSSVPTHTGPTRCRWTAVRCWQRMQLEMAMTFLLGLALVLAPLAIAYWPRLFALAVEHKGGSSSLPKGLTPFVAALLSGLDAVDMIAAGFMWIIARTTQGPAAGSKEPAPAAAESYLRDSLCPQGALSTDAREVALSIMGDNNTTTFDVSTEMAGLLGSAQNDARNIGLLRNGDLIGKVLVGLAIVEIAVVNLYTALDRVDDDPLLVGGLVALLAGLNVDPRSFAGAMLTGHLRRLRSALRAAAADTGSIDSPEVRSLVPMAATAAETEVWAVAVGCRTVASQKTSARLGSLAHSAAGSPGQIRYTEAFVSSGRQLARFLTSPFRAHRARRPGPDGDDLVLW